MSLSKEHYEILKTKYNTELERAYKLNYTRNLTNPVRRELAAIYQATFNDNPRDLLSSCNQCTYNGLLRLAKAFYQYKPEKEEETPEEIIETPEQIVHGEDNYGTIDGLPVPVDNEALITPEPVKETLDQVPAPELPEKAPKKSNNTKNTKKK